MKRGTPQRRAKTAIMTVDNPEFVTGQPQDATNPRFVDAVVSLRESSIVTLARNGVLNADQVDAAWHFRKAWEDLSRLRQPSLLFEKIDGCGFPQELARGEREEESRRLLTRCRILLGQHGFDLVTKICGEGYHIRDLYHSRRERDTATDLLRIHLTGLAAVIH